MIGGHLPTRASRATRDECRPDAWRRQPPKSRGWGTQKWRATTHRPGRQTRFHEHRVASLQGVRQGASREGGNHRVYFYFFEKSGFSGVLRQCESSPQARASHRARSDVISKNKWKKKLRKKSRIESLGSRAQIRRSGGTRRSSPALRDRKSITGSFRAARSATLKHQIFF